MTAGPSAFCLDLTRLVSRLGLGPATGVDRVEAAWLHHLLGRDEALFALVRTAAGFVLLDRPGVAALALRLSGRVAPARADLLSRLMWRGAPMRARAEAEARRASMARAVRPGLARMLARHLPAGVAYLNLGHANLDDRVMRAFAGLGARRVVMVHDTIPLDYPAYARVGVPEVFARKMAVVARGADLVIHSTAAVRAMTEPHLARLGARRVPPGVVAPLGVPAAGSGALPDGLDPARPWFVALGTIEPRKNIGLLLDVWDRLAAAGGVVPQLVVVGRRGWADAGLLSRLDRAVAAPGGAVIEVAGLGDEGVAHVLAGARALLFPSLAEGYGLPPVEAAALGTPVVCAPLGPLCELLGDYPVYADPYDVYPWQETISRLSAAPRRCDPLSPPTWEAHFKAVLNSLR